MLLGIGMKTNKQSATDSESLNTFVHGWTCATCTYYCTTNSELAVIILTFFKRAKKFL